MDRTKKYLMLARVLDWIGNIWLILACLFILIGYIAIVVTQGWGRLWDTISLYNFWNFVAVVGTLLPGILLKIVAKGTKDKYSVSDKQI
ncbi:MAG: hypothetical protein NTY79_06800 [Chloroflexi bacterium]|nr:hypothetical protein [Chloroflexota bacterium]